MDDPAPEEFAVGGFALTRGAPERIVARRELMAAMSARGGQITGTVTYDGALFESRSIDRIVADFIAALSLSHANCTRSEENQMSSLTDTDFEHTGAGRPPATCCGSAGNRFTPPRSSNPAARSR